MFTSYSYPPFYDTNHRNLFKKIKHGQYEFHANTAWDYVSDDAKDLVRKLLCVNENNRYTAKQVLRHPWISRQNNDLEKTLLGSSLVYLRENLQVIDLMISCVVHLFFL